MINLGFLGTNTVSYNIHIPLNSKSIKFWVQRKITQFSVPSLNEEYSYSPFQYDDKIDQ